MSAKKGHIVLLKTRFKIGNKQKSEKNHNWLGDKVSYRGIHLWVSRNYGKPKTCEHCKKTNLIKYQINWCNISGKYKRERNDWIRLCRKCHKAFDVSMNRWKNYTGRLQIFFTKCKCGNKYKAKGMCNKCYQKYYKLKNIKKNMKKLALTKREAEVLTVFMKFKSCPSMPELSKKVKISSEYTRKIMWSLVTKKYIAVNKKLKARKFYVKG